MGQNKLFLSKFGKIRTPVFFPDATRAVLKSLDSEDIRQTKTPGVLVNTYHLYLELGKEVLRKHGGVGGFMGWKGGIVSDSGGFQLMSLVKQTGNGKVSDEGIVFRPSRKKKIMFTPEKSMTFQVEMGADMVVVLDDFTPPTASYEEARETVMRTINWAKRSKEEFEKIYKTKKMVKGNRPYLLGVVQGGFYEELRRFCAQELVKIGFDGLGYGGWPIKDGGNFDYRSAEIIAEEAPKGYWLYGLGIGKPDEVVKMAKMGYQIFDCVLPTRDARHKRLYIYNAVSVNEIDIRRDKFWQYYMPDKEKYYKDNRPVSLACDCLLCRQYSRAYLNHLFRVGDMTAGRLATIHNLRFYSILMEKIAEELG